MNFILFTPSKQLTTRKKCDESYPICDSCKKRKTECSWTRTSDNMLSPGYSIDECNKKEITSLDSEGLINIFFNSPDITNQNVSTPHEHVIATKTTLRSFERPNVKRSTDLEERNEIEIATGRDIERIEELKFLFLDELVQDYLNEVKIQEIDILRVSVKSNNTGIPLSLKYEEENMFLKHLFERVAPLLHALTVSPWMVLILKYCNFAIARSSFIALASIHLYNLHEYRYDLYQKSLVHINKVTEYLLKTITLNTLKSKNLYFNMQCDNKIEMSLLIYVYINFTLLESGKSSTARQFFEVFANCFKEEDLKYDELKEKETEKDDNLYFLIIVLSWFDTIAAITSYDCRMPYCDIKWFKHPNSEHFSTLDVMGCPSEIFEVLWKLCHIRFQLARNIQSLKDIEAEFPEMANKLLLYRDYVLKYENDKSFSSRLKCAQGWFLAAYVKLLRVVKPDGYEVKLKACVHEFIELLDHADPNEAVVQQMVWPLFTIGSYCDLPKERQKWLVYVQKLQLIVNTGTLETLIYMMKDSWDSGVSSNLVVEDLYARRIDFLPL